MHAPATTRVLPASGFNRERTPRPLGVVSGMPWQPRVPHRNHATASISRKFVEWIAHKPVLQQAGAAVSFLWHAIAVRDSYPPPPNLAPEAGSWKFAAIGDYGTGSPQQARVAANLLAGRPELVVTTGDNVYPSGRWQDYARNFDPPHLMGTIVQRARFMPAIGNHDVYADDLRPYFGHFPHLKGRPYYAYTHRNAHFMALDSNQDLRPGSAQYRWLEQQLKRSGSKWRVVYLHYPMYASKGGYEEIRKSLQPLLAHYGVQLVLSGHEHDYQRTQAIDGVTHIITGGGGQQVWGFGKKAPGFIANRKAAYHHVEVSVGRQHMVVRTIDEHRRVIDVVRIPATAAQQARAGVAQLAGTGRRRRTAATAG